MGRKKNQAPGRINWQQIRSKIQGRKISASNRLVFQKSPRSPGCLFQAASKYLEITELDRELIRSNLAHECETIEHQFVALRDQAQLKPDDFTKRMLFTKHLLNCLRRHHQVIYEGILFGSSVNGLGFRDSDVDLRLRPLTFFKDAQKFEPFLISEALVNATLQNIAHQTTKCSPAIGEFVPSSKCPIAKLIFMDGCTTGKCFDDDFHKYREGLKFDISMGARNCLGSFNSRYLRFLCHLEPKFSLLATFVRYWSVEHGLIIPGSLSSYALINMLIFFCQTTEPPLLPTVDQMRDMTVKIEEAQSKDDLQISNENSKKGMVHIDWLCTLCLDKSCYQASLNQEPLSILLLKFFEFYLKFPYKTHIITTRPGKALTHEEFRTGPQHHPVFPIKPILNIQDPFDLKHNLTSGMCGRSFRSFMQTMKQTYELLFHEVLNNFENPSRKKGRWKGSEGIDWGLNALLVNRQPVQRK